MLHFWIFSKHLNQGPMGITYGSRVAVKHLKFLQNCPGIEKKLHNYMDFGISCNHECKTPLKWEMKPCRIFNKTY
jgi:hypothetical protein